VLFQHLIDLRNDAQTAHQKLHQTELRMLAIADTVQSSCWWRTQHRWNKLRKWLGSNVEPVDPLIAAE